MKNLVLLISIPLLLIGCAGEETAKPEDKTDTPALDSREDAPTIELVFCLDATGSMSGLIHTAKEKIWDIVTSLAQSSPSPNIKLGMIFYRDKGDLFVTKTYPLTLDIDSIYTELLAIDADGGGDSPESVNQALYEAVEQMNWSKDENVYQTIFLVGDCPPHMDYDEVQYPESCKKASEKGIIINTIKLGLQCHEAIDHFKAMAECSNGEYQQLGQDAGDQIIATPYDDSVNHYSYQIDGSKMYYGSYEEQETMYTRKGKTMQLYMDASEISNSSRAAYNTTEAGKANWFGDNELVQDIIEEKVSLDTLSKEQLPAEMKELTSEEQKQYVQEEKEKREYNIEKLKEFNQKRSEFIQKELESSGDTSSFSKEIFKTMQKQAKEEGVIIGK